MGGNEDLRVLTVPRRPSAARRIGCFELVRDDEDPGATLHALAR
jgi:hypothetical protein